jgi:lysozyme
VYNIGIGQFKTSTLYAKAIINPNDPKIADEFRRWNKAGGQVLQGLVKRREAELWLYFQKGSFS